MKVTEHIESMLKKGRSRRELVELGFPKATVTRVQKTLKQEKVASRRTAPKDDAKPQGRSQPHGQSAAKTARAQPERTLACDDPARGPHIVELLPQMAALLAVTKKLGADKQASCPFYEDGLCTLEAWASREDIPDGIGEPALVGAENPRWLVKPSLLYCAMCTMDQDYRLVELEQSVQANPLSGVRGEFRCQCGATRNIAAVIKCTNCGQQMWWGWFPK